MEFKRINFFKGFFTHAEDWQAMEAYRNAKSQLHNQYLHGAGIVHGHLDDLRIDVTDDGTSLYVGAGLAIDAHGREVLLPGSQTVPVSPQDFKLPSTVYVLLRYDEEKTDRRENVANPEYSDYAFVRELARIEISADPPLDGGAIELARIALSKRATRIAMPGDPFEPGENEIDLRYRLRAGVARGRWQLEDFATLVDEAQALIARRDNYFRRISEETAEEGDPFAYYLVSAYPLSQATITWQIQSSVDERGAIEHTLILSNLSDVDVNVRWRVYRVGIPFVRSD